MHPTHDRKPGAPLPERAAPEGPAAAAPAPPALRVQRAVGNARVQRLLGQPGTVGPEGGALPAGVESGIRAARGGGQALDGDVLRRMEGTFGADFGGVRVHADTRADALSRSLSARAFTTGRDVFFRRGEYAPASDAGRRLLAHELTHVVQQSGAPVQRALRVGPAGDAHEREAEALSAGLAGGEGAGPVRAGDAGGTVRRAVVFADDLEKAKAEQAARDADAARGLTPGELALLATLPLAPAIPGILLIHLSPALLRAFLERLPTEMIARAVGQLPASLIAPVLGPVVVHLDPFRAREVVRGLGRDRLRELIAAPETRAALEAAMRMVLNQLWPVGFGFSLDGGVGMTFGIPIYAGMSYMMYLWHSSSGVFKFMRRVEGKLAFDYGAGAIAYVGQRGKAGGQGGAGAGAVIGGNVEVGGKLAMLQDFEFRVFEDAAFLSLLLAVGGSDLRRPESVGIGLLESIHGLKVDPMHFNTRTRVDAALYAQLAAEASAGLRTAPAPAAGTAGAAGTGAPGGAPGGAGAGTGTEPAAPQSRLTSDATGWRQKTRGAPDMGSPFKGDWKRILTGGGLKWADLLERLNASLGGRLFGQAGAAAEAKPRQPAGAGTKARAPVGTMDAEQLEVDVMAEASVAADLTARIPSLRPLIPEVAMENGGGIKLSYVLTRGVPFERAVRLEGFSVYHKRGELDYYAGVAEETELKIRAGAREGYLPNMPSTLEEVPAGLSDLLSRVGELRVRRRVPLGMFRGAIDDFLQGRDYRTAERRQQGARALLKEKYKAWGITTEGFVTFTLVLGRDELERVLRMLRDTVADVVGGPNPWRDLLYDVWYFLATGKAPLYVRRAAAAIADLVKVTELVLHEQAGVVGAAGIGVAAGGKVRAHGRGAALGFYDSDNLVEAVPLTPGQILRILQAVSSVVF